VVYDAAAAPASVSVGMVFPAKDDRGIAKAKGRMA